LSKTPAPLADADLGDAETGRDLLIRLLVGSGQNNPGPQNQALRRGRGFHELQ
jgi:hypothetical protein